MAVTLSDHELLVKIAASVSGGLSIGAVTNDGSFANETGGNLAAIKSDTDSLVTNTTAAAALVRGQAVIAVTGTRIQLGAHALVDGVIVKALAANTNPILVGGSDVDNKYDGTGKGDILDKGDRNFYKVNNTNVLYVNGTAGDIVSFEGV